MATPTPTTTTTTSAGSTEGVVVLQPGNGIALIPRPTPLTRLNYFDGKFLRATDMQSEQAYHRRLQQLAARAAGSGVADGFDLRLLAGDQIELAAGLAIDPEGRVLHMPMEATVQIDQLIARSQGSVAVKAGRAPGSAVFTLCDTAAVTPVTGVVAGTSLYVVGISHAEALCGQEDVMGRLCEEACATATERPQRLEGVVLRALPLQLASPLPDSTAETMTTSHLRSRVASSYFADEARQVESLTSGSGLRSGLWCTGAAASTGSFLPLAVLARAGGHTVFLDAWTARRECIDTGPRRHWQWRMMMRPWDVFLAQVLQFQCQFRDAWSPVKGSDDDPCADLRRSVVEVGDLLNQLDRQYRETSLRLVRTDTAATAAAVPLSRTLLDSALKRATLARGALLLQPTDRVLIRRGIVELPAAGYLPVAPGSAFPVNEQVRRLMGDGVDLRFCVVRPDFVAHALEEAQHMQRISLLRGLDNPKLKEEVDILVPDGQIFPAGSNTGAGWAVKVARVADSAASRVALHEDRAIAGAVAYQRDVLSGAARTEVLGDGSAAFFFAGLVETAARDKALAALKEWAGKRDNGLEATLWKSVALMNEPATKGGTDARSAAGTRARAGAAPDATPAGQATRFAALREQAVAYRLKTLERVAVNATTSGIHHFEGLKDGVDHDHTALWLALRAEADPFEAAEGSRVDMSLSLSVISPKRGGTQFVDVDIVGAQFIVESRTTSGQRAAVQGTLRGAAIIAGLVGTLANSQRGLQFSVPALLTREPTASGSDTRVETDFSGLLFDGRGVLGLDRLGVRVSTEQQQRKDGSSAPQARVLVTMSAQGTSLDLAARLQRDDSVLRIGHPLRTASETAIDVLATRESAPAFATQAHADLFGTRAPADEALTVRATLDWVLFHRRRTRNCGGAPAVAPLEQRRYEIHHVRARTEAQVRSARAAVVGANVDAIRKAGFAPAGAVTFDGGRSSIATPTDALLADWQAAQPGSLMRFGAIGSQGAAQAEGDAMAQSRLASLESTLAHGRPQAGLENQVLPVLPALNLSGWDGAVFIVTLDKPTVCHDVVRVQGSEQFKAFLDTSQQLGLVAAMRQFERVPFARADFQSDGSTLQAESLLKLRDGWGDLGTPQSQAAVFHAGGSAIEKSASAQTVAIATALGGDDISVTALASDQLAQVTGCIGLSVLVQRPPVTMGVLVGFALLDGGFIFGTSAVMGMHVFLEDVPADDQRFDDAIRTMLQRKPNTLWTTTQTEAAMPAALPVKDFADNRLKALGITSIAQSNQQVLGEAEIQGIERMGFDRSSWQVALIFTPNG